MDVSLIIKIAGVGMLIAVTYQILQRAGRDEQAMMLSLAAIVLVHLRIVGELCTLYGKIRDIFGI